MLVQLEAGNRRVTGLSLDTEETFETPFTRARQSASRLHHDHRRLRQIVRLLRGAVHARAGAQPHQRIGDRAKRASSRDAGYSEIQLLGPEREQLSRSVAGGLGFRDAAATAWAAVPGIRRVRFTTSHPRDFVKPSSTPSTTIRRCAITCIFRCSPARRAVLNAHAAALHARRIHAAHRVDEEAARRRIAITTDIIVGFPARRKTIWKRRSRCWMRWNTIRCSASNTRAGRTPPRWLLDDQIPRRRKDAAADDRPGKAARHPDPAQCGILVGTSKNAWWRVQSRQQVSGSDGPRRTRRSTLFMPQLRRRREGATLAGTYVRRFAVTRAGPNSLAGGGRFETMRIGKGGHVWKSK